MEVCIKYPSDDPLWIASSSVSSNICPSPCIICIDAIACLCILGSMSVDIGLYMVTLIPIGCLCMLII